MVKAFCAVVQLPTLVASVDTLFLTADDVGAFSLLVKRSKGTAAKYRTAAPAPFSEEAVIAG